MHHTGVAHQTRQMRCKVANVCPDIHHCVAWLNPALQSTQDFWLKRMTLTQTQTVHCVDGESEPVDHDDARFKRSMLLDHWGISFIGVTNIRAIHGNSLNVKCLWALSSRQNTLPRP